MIRPNHKIDQLSVDEKIAAACHDAGEQAVLRAERTGTDVIVWRDGKIVRLSASEARAELSQNSDRPKNNG
ncbi:hypothetical protein FF011L_26550 [Roseimaritima multifibrata]|uniref:Uncharacterized protein n=1 Tax=Roseimaritima multifibrata TaxID=1930274 RepID=A0A517MG69_9BACT|nr:hypothetical protein [Roseimaritima multifibrata]QDS93879.1 hypothetical protein FF011L_26550 [Roseimaritima multifibrata]